MNNIQNGIVTEKGAVMPNATYDNDLYSWSLEQAALLKAKKFDQVDWEHIIEEIEDVSKSEKRALQSFLETLLMHLLKWEYQPTFQGRSWRLTIIEQRNRLVEHLLENPGLKSKLGETIVRAYRLARLNAAKETGLSVKSFPEDCPWNYPTFINDDFWPGNEED